MRLSSNEIHRYLCSYGTNASLGVPENGIALSVSTTQSKSNSEPNRERPSTEEQDAGNYSDSKSKTGLHQGVGDDYIPLR